MAFTLPDDLAPELYPLAWLVGTWRGYGILTYGETVPEQAVYQEMSFDHDGGPYLRQTTTIWTVDATPARDTRRPPGPCGTASALSVRRGPELKIRTGSAPQCPNRRQRR